MKNKITKKTLRITLSWKSWFANQKLIQMLDYPSRRYVNET